jgi:transcriptional regulator with XRE-family HTH domain
MALTDEDVGRFIQRLRVERGLTQADLARRVRMHRTAISRLENGYRAVTVPELVEFAGVLGIAAGSTAILSQLSPRASHVATERPEEIELSRSRPDTPVTNYDLITILMSRALNAGVKRLQNTSKGLSGAIRALVLGSADAVATVFLTIAMWAGLLVIWFALFSFMLNGRHQSANTGLGQGEEAWVLLAIVLGASLSGGGAYALALSIRGLIGRLVAYAQPQLIATRPERHMAMHQGPLPRR